MALADVRFTSADCELFERYPRKVRFRDELVPPADKERFRDLRMRLKEVATAVAAEAQVAVPLRAHASSYSQNGYSQTDLWACAYPAVVPNKSYGLQVAAIVSARGVEVCLCLGAGQSQLRDPADTAEAEAALAQLKVALSTVPTAVVGELTRRLGGAFREPALRRRWREEPHTSDFATLRQWLAYASGPDGEGASISVDVDRDDVQYERIGPMLLQMADASAPLLERVYGQRAAAPAARRAARRRAPAQRALKQGPRRITARLLGPLARELYVDTSLLQRIADDLDRRNQVVLYGPPGTGKTFVAQRLAELLAPDEACRELVQFHPSYSYQDFVIGFRPVGNGDGGLAYELQDGPLLRLARHAAAHPDERHILIVDELNRGNLPRVFGELLYLLDYRDRPISLMHTPPPGSRAAGPPFDASGRFKLPGNLWVVATMNTADRSIGQIDVALRRRFCFVPFFPGEGELDGLLARWVARQRTEVRPLAGWVDALNAQLREDFGRHLQVGHSYFMRDRLTLADVRRIWASDIMPFLEEQLFGHPASELAKYELSAIRAGR